MSIFPFVVKEQWMNDFENEEINDERWSCLMSAVVESKPDDEEYLGIFTHFVTIKAPIIRTISMLDVIALFKTPTEGKKKTEAKVKNKPKLDNADESTLFTPPPPRFPEIVPYLSKYAVISDGACKLTPVLMAYAIKYLVLCLKDEDYFQRKVMRTVRRQTIEAEVKAEVLKIMKEDPRERVNMNDGETSELWHKNRFDIFGDPLKDGPFYGPEMYIVLLDFYDPLIFPELQRLNVPFRAVIKIENFHPSSGNTLSGSKKSDLINNFWSLLEANTQMDDIALLKYVVPLTDKGNAKDMDSVAATSLISVLYSLFNVCRLHHIFIQQMKVHRMNESLEPLNLSKCVVYNELCDALVMEDHNAEIYILFSMIEQIVAGVPETGHRALDDKTETNSSLRNEEEFQEAAPRKYHEANNLQREKQPSGRTTAIFFYDDKISLAALPIDPDILKPSEIFERFIINSISLKIRKKFASLTQALKAQSDFSFYQMWVKRKENKEVFRVKLFFLIIMRLIERIRAFDIENEVISPESEIILSPVESSEEREKSSEQSLIHDQPHNLILSEINDLFYKELKIEKKYENISSTATREVRKADATLVLGEKSTLSDENLDIACGRCPKLSIHEKPADHQLSVKKLEQFLESPEITHLNDPNLLANRAKFDAFVKKQNFYETFEPNRTVQKLQELSNGYNTIDYTYFAPTDTLFALAYNDTDLRGIYHSLESGFITSPLPLRHFVRYVVPEKKKWVAAENKKYIMFLKEIERKISDEEKRKTHELRCEFLKKYKAKTNLERFLVDGPTEGMENRLDTRKGTEENSDEIQSPYLEDLPVKTTQSLPEIKFFGVDSGGTRIQVNVDNYEFHSRDGSTVGVKTQSWLHLGTVVTLTIQKLNCRLIVHRWTEDLEKRQMLFRDPSGIMVTFGMDFRPFPVKITQPNGLVIEIIKAGARHIKQTYIKPYRWGEHIMKEECRYYLYDGKVLIFHVEGIIDVLCPSGTKYTCYKFESGEVEVFDTLTQTGELWVRNDCSKCMPAKKTMNVIMGVDSGTKEIYCKREDGTTCMLWPDGKLVTTYPDGTKITTTPKFEEGDLIIEREQDNATLTETDRPSICFGEDQLPEDGNGFTIVSCSYLMEHPNYGTVYSESPGLEIRILGKMKVEMSSRECLRIECHHTVLKASSQNAKFYTFCRNCRERNVSTVFFESDNLLSKSKDYYGQRLYVYCSGRILHKPEKENNEEEETPEKYGESPPLEESKCEYHKCSNSQRRCLAIERDLTGLEFIDTDTFSLYNGSLSQDAYYDLGRPSADKTQLHHAFFNPVYHVGREKYIMKYEKNDGFPSRLTRNNLKGSCDIKSVINPGRKPKRRELPKAIVARFIQVLLPDPITVMKDITKEITVCRSRSLDLSSLYSKGSKKGKQGPFAKYIAKELELIASTLCPSLKLYPHTCSLTPYTEMDIHSATHYSDRNIFFMESNPYDCQRESLPRCKRIPKPLKHKKNNENIPEVAVEDDNSTTVI